MADQRLYRVLLWIGVGATGLTFAAGLVGSWSRTTRLPGLDQSPFVEARRAERDQDRSRAAREYRSASRLVATSLPSTLEVAESLARVGDYAAAGEVLMAAAQRWGDVPKIQASLGWVLFFQGKKDQAEKWLRTSIQRDPGNARAFAGLGEVLLDRGAYAEAEAAFRRSLALEPSAGEVYNNLGVALALSGHPRRAIPEFTRSLELGHTEAAANLERARASLEEEEGEQP